MGEIFIQLLSDSFILFNILEWQPGVSSMNELPLTLQPWLTKKAGAFILQNLPYQLHLPNVSHFSTRGRAPDPLCQSINLGSGDAGIGISSD